jgi:phosphopantothenoylcysteine synthetase/decarboxylase
LRRWADLIVIAPLSANTLAKLANGMSDNLLVRPHAFGRAWACG